MSRTSQSAKLLGNIYGPYPDHFILKEDFPRAGVKLSIQALQLHYRGNKTIIGFDETEYITNPPIDSPITKNPEVVFFGVIEIDDLDWLSDKGFEHLERDFKDYNERIHLDHCRSKLTLRTAYEIRKSDGPLLKVRVCCKKNLLALFLTSKNDPEKLMIYSQFEQKQRTYWVRSIHAQTYAASRNFFDRYRLRALIVELIDTDPKRTPLEDRNIDWLIRRYFQTIIPRDKENRIITEPSLESDVSDEPRHLRHIPRAEIRGYFAAHSEWLLAHQIARKQGSANLLNIRQWIAFCKEARADSIAAKEHYTRWGLPHGVDAIDDEEPYNLARNLAQFGETEQFWSTQLRNIQKKKAKPSKQRAPTSPEIGSPRPTVPPVVQFQYDSDFSEPSTPEASDSEPEYSRTNHHIPWFCMQAPRIPPGRFTWNCPGCSYSIDLLNLSPENLAVLPDDTTRVLSGKSWKVDDKPVQRALSHMVSHHYEVQHLERNGIRLVKSGAGVWGIKTSRTASSQTRRVVASVKVEDHEGGLTVPRRSERIPRRRRHVDQ